ncbi:hypothetical protein J6590_105375 [Homalodisca vitripennis]|nr:hypothetical protein J6590_105375 [Homalodisca vitripennis]
MLPYAEKRQWNMGRVVDSTKRIFAILAPAQVSKSDDSVCKLCVLKVLFHHEKNSGKCNVKNSVADNNKLETDLTHLCSQIPNAISQKLLLPS